VQTDSPSYRKGDTVGVSVLLRNSETTAYSTLLRVKIADPSGATIFESSAAVPLPEDGVMAQDFSAALPVTVQGGEYAITAELFDVSGRNIGFARQTFGVATSRINVTPTLPAAFGVGANDVTFSLANTGDLPVESGALEVTLKDPDGVVISTASQTFALGLGQNHTINMTLSIPSLKFGTYTLSYTQRDETANGLAKEIALPNGVGISALYDNNSHRVRNTAGLTVVVTNTGRFNLDSAGAGLPVSVSVPAAGYSETKMLVPAPAVGNSAGSMLLYSFVIPETVTAAQHGTRITASLPSGSASVQTTQLAITESSLSLAPLEPACNAGDVIRPVVANDGGVDTTVQYRVSLYDARSSLIAETANGATATAGSTLPLEVAVPAGAVDGNYRLEVNYKDLKTGKEQLVTNALTVNGVKGSLQVQTNKENYLLTETITGLSAITNSGTGLAGGNLHLEVTTGAGVQKTKTWTTKADFQTSPRSGVDTYGVNDWIIPDDDFSGSAIDPNRWGYGGNVSMQNGKIFIDSSSTSSGLWSNWLLEGDFDIEVEFHSSTSVGNQGPQFSVSSSTLFAVVHNNSASGWTGDIRFGGGQIYKAVGGYATSGRYRMVRTGTTNPAGATILLQYWNGSSWSEIASGSSTLAQEPVQVALYPWRSGIGTGPSAAYDNFKVNSGRVKSQNQSVDSVRLLPLDDNFDDGVFNEDRWLSANGPKPIESSGALRLQGSATTQTHAIHLRSRLPGDFSAVAAYRNFAAQPSGSSKGEFALMAAIDAETPETQGTAFYVLRGSDSTSRVGGQYVVGLSNVGASYFIGRNVEYPSHSGMLRLTRGGTTGYDEYWDGSGWTANHANTMMNPGPALILLSAYTETNYPTVQVDIDKFSTNKGTYAATGKIFPKHDSGISGNRWGKVLYTADLPAGTSISIRTRTAETEAGLPGAIWSSYTTGSGSAVSSPAARWIQIEVHLTSAHSYMTPILRDLTVTYQTNPGEVLWEADLPAALLPGAATEIQSTIGALGMIGNFTLSGILTSGTGQTIASADSSFHVEAGNIQVALVTDKKSYRPGETVTVSGEVRNLSGIATNGITTRVLGALGVVNFQESYDLAANSVRPFTFTTTAGNIGSYQFSATVTQNSATVADAAAQYEVAAPSLTALLNLPDSVGSAPFAISLSLTNTGKVAASTRALVTDDGGNTVDDRSVTLAAGENRVLQYTRQIAASTTYSATLGGDLNQTFTRKVLYIAPVTDIGVSGKIAVDKVAYNPNDPVTLTATVSAASAMENLSTLVAVANSAGQGVYSARSAITALNQGQTVTGRSYWNTGSYPAGTYLVTLQILDAAGSVLGKATSPLVISSTMKPSALLRGRLTLDKQSLLAGETVNLTYELSNTGNVDLADVALAIRTFDLTEERGYDAISDRTTLAVGASSSNSGSIDTRSYSAKDYLVVLSATIAGVEETLAGSYFRVEGAPSVPALAGPAIGSDVETLTPALTVSNAADPNADKLGYQFEIYADSGLAAPVTSGVVSEMAGSTSWAVPAPLTENKTYWWRVRAFDGLLYGPWMATASFRVNAANDLPSAPSIASPMDGSQVAVFTPLLSVGNAADPDSANLTYNFQIATDPSFTQLVASVQGIAGGEATTSWTVPENLQENGTYYWRAQADDWLIEGPWSAAARFMVNTANEAPAMPVVVAPASGATITALATDAVAANSSDPDSSALSYYFEADTVPTFDLPHILRSGSVTEGGGTTFWRLSGLNDNTWYYLRVKAGDGTADSPWSESSRFFVNTANDPPTTPILANPSSGGAVNVPAPALSVHNASDLDGDLLSYAFEVYGDEAMTNLVARGDDLAETTGVTAWQMPVNLTENQTYYWRARSFDGALYGDWMPPASFTVNTANDAPDAPKLSSPADGSSVVTPMPTLAVVNAVDPDSDNLTYDFEIFSGGSVVAGIAGVTGDSSGITTWTPGTPLADNTIYQWRARAYDGDSYGPWTAMATFTVHIPITSINATVDFDPDTLNKSSKGSWVVVYLELPDGYKPVDVDISSIRLEGIIPAETRPYGIGDHDKDGIADLMVKFKRSDLINLLREGDSVPVQVTGKVGAMLFEGVDVIRVIK